MRLKKAWNRKGSARTPIRAPWLSFRAGQVGIHSGVKSGTSFGNEQIGVGHLILRGLHLRMVGEGHLLRLRQTEVQDPARSGGFGRAAMAVELGRTRCVFKLLHGVPFSRTQASKLPGR